MKEKLILLATIILFTCCAPKKFNKKWLKEKSPKTFKARFETTQGIFDIEAKRAWSPKGVDRL